jgi:hypothetical protein
MKYLIDGRGGKETSRTRVGESSRMNSAEVVELCNGGHLQVTAEGVVSGLEITGQWYGKSLFL